MIISHKYKFIFIKTRKTAGTSIELFLGKLCGPEDVITPIEPPEASHDPRNYRGFFNPFPEIFLQRGKKFMHTFRHFLKRRKFRNHRPGYLIKCRVPNKIWNTYYKFCVERNPWDKTISHFYHQKAKYSNIQTLDDYFALGKECQNYQKYTDYRDPDKIIVDRVISYENLIEDIGEVFQQLGIPFEGVLGVNAKGSHRKDRRHYREVFTPAQKERVESIYAREIAMHGYEF